jgi:hypothetical protein
MNNVQLDSILRNNHVTMDYYGGVRACDRLPIYVTGRPKFYIANTKPHDHPGEHWVCLYFDDTSEFYDSTGNRPQSYSAEFEYMMVIHSPQYLYNTKRIQNYFSNCCGQHCLFYAFQRCLGYSMREIINQFTDNLSENDKTVVDFYDKLVRM